MAKHHSRHQRAPAAMEHMLLVLALVVLGCVGTANAGPDQVDGAARKLLQDVGQVCTDVGKEYLPSYNRTHVGHDIPGTCGRFDLTPAQLAAECLQTCDCAAFTTDGCLKTARGNLAAPSSASNPDGSPFCLYQVIDMQAKPGCNNSFNCPDIPGFIIGRRTNREPSAWFLDGDRVCHPELTLQQLADKCRPDCACKGIGEDGCMRSKRGESKGSVIVDFCFYEIDTIRNCTCREVPGYTSHQGMDFDGFDIREPNSCSRDLPVLNISASCDSNCCYMFHERGCMKNVSQAADVSLWQKKFLKGPEQKPEADFCAYARINTSAVSCPAPTAAVQPTSSGLSTGAVVGIAVSVSAGVLALALAGLLWWRRRKAQKNAGWDADGLASKTWMLGSAAPVPALNVPGVNQGEAFMRATAYAYKWVTLSPEERGAMEAVEAGVNDARLDAQAPAEGTMAGPAVQLSAEELAQDVQLVQGGLLGRGGAAIVFECTWPSRFGPKAVLAAKVLKDGYESDPAILQSFTYEASVLASLYPPHDNVVRLYGYCLEPPTVCLIMELLPRSLKDVLHPAPPALPATTSSGGGAVVEVSVRMDYTKGGKGDTTPSGVTSELLTPVMPKAGNADGDGPTMHSAVMSNATPASPVADAPTTTTDVYASSVTASTDWETMPLAKGAGAKLPPTPASMAGCGKPLTMSEVVQFATDIAAGLKFLHERPLAGFVEAAEAMEGAEGSTRHSSGVAGLPTMLSAVLETPVGGDTHMSGEVNSTNHSGMKSVRCAHIIHRDLKPANILLNSRGTAKLSDFGLARPQQRTTLMTDHLGAGTLAYMSPEQLAGKVIGNIATERVDIYAAAIMMWEMLSGRVPWAHLPQSTVVAMVLRGRRPELPPAPKLDPEESRDAALRAMADVPAGLDVCPEYNAIIRAAWQQREHRRPSAAQLHEMLTALLASMRGQACGPVITPVVMDGPDDEPVEMMLEEEDEAQLAEQQ